MAWKVTSGTAAGKGWVTLGLALGPLLAFLLMGPLPNFNCISHPSAGERGRGKSLPPKE